MFMMELYLPPTSSSSLHQATLSSRITRMNEENAFETKLFTSRVLRSQTFGSQSTGNQLLKTSA